MRKMTWASTEYLGSRDAQDDRNMNKLIDNQLKTTL